MRPPLLPTEILSGFPHSAPDRGLHGSFEVRLPKERDAWRYSNGVSERPYTSKQMGDACEMLVAAELTLAGMPAMKVPDNWPCYDVIAQPPNGGQPQRISVRSRTFKRGGGTYVSYDVRDEFDWLAIVLLAGAGVDERRIYIVPRSVADAKARRDKPTSKTAHERFWRQDEVPTALAAFKDNYCLSPLGNGH